MVITRLPAGNLLMKNMKLTNSGLTKPGPQKCMKRDILINHTNNYNIEK